MDATALVGSWRVLGAAGEAPGEVLDLGETLVLYRPCGELMGDWQATAGGIFLAETYDSQGACTERLTADCVPAFDLAGRYQPA